MYYTVFKRQLQVELKKILKEFKKALAFFSEICYDSCCYCESSRKNASIVIVKEVPNYGKV